MVKKVSVSKIIGCASVVYIIGLFGESYFGLIKPLQEYPIIWESLKLVKKMIQTTRNGFFFGFIFVAMGLYFAKANRLIKVRYALIGFIVSLMALYMEVSFVTKHNWRIDDDMYIGLIPTILFLFNLALQVKLKEHKCWKNLRLMSALIYYTHTWIKELISVFFATFNIAIGKTGYHFILTVVGSILVANVIIKLSHNERFDWLKKLYT